MLIALALAAAMQPAPEVYRDEYGCRWRRRPVAESPKKRTHLSDTGQRAVTAAPGNRRPPGVDADTVRVQRHASSKAKPKANIEQPADEFVGCDPEGFGIWRSDLETIEPALELVPPVAFSRPEPIPDTEPATFAEACDCSTSAPGMPTWPGTIGGPILSPIHPLAPIPEAPVWLAMLAGLALIIRKSA